MSTSTKAAIYCRISKDTEKRGLGVERQEKLCRELAEGRGWDIEQMYVDNDISAYSGKPRPGYQSMLEAIEAGVINAIVAYHPDRLHRQTRELEPFIDLVEAKGTQIATVSGGELDLSNPSGRAVAKTVGAWAQYESEQKARRVLDQKAESAHNGWWQGGRRPYGFVNSRTSEGHATLVIRPEEANIIRELAEGILAGKSLRVLATELNQRGIPTAAGQDRIDEAIEEGLEPPEDLPRWRGDTIKNLLTNGTVAGMRTYQGEVTSDANWPAILPQHTWEQVRAILERRARKPAKRGRPSKHLLSGLLECSQCGRTLIYRTRTNQKPSYVCQPTSGATEPCGKTSITAEPLEKYIREVAIDTLKLSKPKVEVADIDTEATTAEIRAVEANLEELSISYHVERELTKPEYMAARTALIEKLGSLRSEMADTDADNRIELEILNVAELWDSSSLEEKRLALSGPFERITILPGNRWTALHERLRIQLTNGEVIEPKG